MNYTVLIILSCLTSVYITSQLYYAIVNVHITENVEIANNIEFNHQMKGRFVVGDRYSTKNALKLNDTNMQNQFGNINNKTFPFLIFQIGLSKAGTRSIHHFFVENNISAVHQKDNQGHKVSKMMKLRYKQNKFILMDYYNQYMVYTDFVSGQHVYVNKSRSYAWMYQILIEQYNDGKFIFNIRSLHHWLRSKYTHYKSRNDCEFMVDCYKVHWGINMTDIQVLRNWAKYYYEYNCDVVTYFEENNMQNNVLIFDIETDNINKLIEYFLKFNLSLNETYWQQNGKTMDKNKLKTYVQIKKWDNLTVEYPELVNYGNYLDNLTTYQQIVHCCKHSC